MEIKQDISFGVIPFYKDGNEWKVFLIHQYGSAGDIFWTFPKGHPEAEESPEVAAQRELFEETALRVSELKTDTPLLQTYQFKHENTLIDKSVTYFPGIITDPAFTIQIDEVKAANWFTIVEAKKQLTHDSAKALLEQAFASIDG